MARHAISGIIAAGDLERAEDLLEVVKDLDADTTVESLAALFEASDNFASSS